jgi:glycosyltransferase involved in cell wall biosynthesis
MKHSDSANQSLVPPRRHRVTVVSASYPPAYLKGGPARSLAALTEQLGDEFDWSVITSAFDDPAAGLMAGVEPGCWIRRGRTRVWYLGEKRPSPWVLSRLVTRSNPDVVYLNSLFSARFSIYPLLAGRLLHPRRQVLLAPRGELSLGAMEIRAWKKSAYLCAFRAMRLHRFVTWHASTEMEAADIRRVFGQGMPPARRRLDLKIGVARDLSSIPSVSGTATGDSSRSIVFLSRIVPMKNLHTLLEAVAQIQGDLDVTVAGPAEDARYWDGCQKLIASLPPNKQVEYIGPVPGDAVVNFLAGFDLFVLPTLGENFGHVVLEALAAGLPVIVGQDTPWAVIEEVGAGWLCDPRDPVALARRIERFYSLSPKAKKGMATTARRLAESMINDRAAREANRDLFRTVCGVTT